jgi:multidrug efflux pump subunit AcrB
VGTILGLFLASLALRSRIGTEFFPETDESQVSIVYRAPIGTRVEKTEQLAQVFEQGAKQALSTGPEGASLIRTMISNDGLPLGRTALFTANTGPHSGNIQVNLIPRTERSLSDVQVNEKLREALRSAVPGTQVFFSTGGIVKRILNFGSSAPIDVEILGQDLEAGSAYAKALQSKLRALGDADGSPLLSDVQLSREENYPELDIQVDRQKAGILGLSEQHIAQVVLGSLVGNTQFAPIPYSDPKTGNEVFVNVRLADSKRSHVSDLGSLSLRAPAGGLVTLDTVARVERSSGPVQISRKYLQRVVDLTANVPPNKDLGTAAAAVQKVLDETPPPEGFSVRQSGQVAAQRDAFSGLFFAGALAIALVYMVLASQFRSLLDPLVIMFSVPLGVSGVFLSLWATNTTLSVNSFMGIIMMVGIVVSNGVLLVDFANVLRARGIPLIEATVQAAKTRLKPILMTTIATILGLVPMALGLGEGSETNLPLARAVIGGLTVSTFFTLFLVPALYSLLERFSKRPPPLEEELGAES